MAQNFPNIGLRAIFEITGYTSNARKYISLTRDIDRATQRTARSVSDSGQKMSSSVARSFEDLVRQSEVLRDLSSMGLLGAGALDQLEQAFSSLGDGIGVNIQQFDELASTGVAMNDAIGLSAQSMGDAAEAAGGFGAQLISAASAAAIVVTALRVTVRVVQQSISEYTELAEATRRLSAETGLLAREASGWVQVAQASGVSASTASRGMSMFLGRVSDLRKEQQLGTESTSDFAEALDFLQVNIEDGEGNLKSTEQLLGEVNRAFQDLGPGIQTAGVAQDLFGRTGRQLLPILTDQEQSLADYITTLDRFGAGMSALNQKEYAEFLRSQFELRAALQGVFNTIASNWIPILGGVADVVSEVIGLYNLFVRELGLTEFSVQSVANGLNLLADILATTNRVLSRTIAFWKDIAATINPLIGLYSRLAAEEEKVAQARAQAAQEAAAQIALEKKRQEAILDTVEQLNELRIQLVEKLDDIEADAEQKWDDILVKRLRDAMDRAAQETRQMDAIRTALNERLAAIEADAAKRWDDILVKRQRDAILRGIRLAQRYEDLARATEQRRQDVLRDFADRETKQRRELQRRVEKVERDARERREKLERDHQRRLRDIRQDFLDTALEAARRNDAVAVARAQRERARELRDEEQRYVDEQEDLQEALQKKRENIERDRKEREQDQRDELARALRRIEENYARQREQLAERNRQERLLRELQYKWELEDFNAAKAEQLQAARDAWVEQIAELKKAQREESELRTLQNKRELEDFNLAKQRKQDEALEWYQQERDELAEHLSLTGQQLEAIYAEWAREAAAAAAEVVRVIAEAVSNEILQYQRLLTEAQRARVQAQLPVPGQPPLPEPDEPRIPGEPILGMAEGGVVQASSPTHIVMGEAGPEMGVFMPGGSSSLNVNHNFSRLGVDIEGMPGGINLQQAQSLFYQMMTQLAKGVQIPRN